MRWRGLLMFALAVGSAQADDPLPEKRWEVGIGVGGITAPDYRGSDTNRSYVAPIPYVVYRGPVFRTDQEGLRGDFLRTDRYEFTASLAVSITPDSDKNTLRRGMPELRSTLEAGPALNLNLTGDGFDEGLSLTLPVRAVFAVGEGQAEYIGVTSAPSLIYRKPTRGNWKWTGSVGPVFATDRYHDYYYTVKPRYALPERPAYEASSGYNGFNAQLALSRRAGDFWYAFYARYSNIQGTDFTDSPLVEVKHNMSGGFAISWVIF